MDEKEKNMKNEEKLMEEKETEFLRLLDEMSKVLTHDDYAYMIEKFRGILRRPEVFDMDERDIAKKPIRSTEARYGMGYDYYDWICPSCKYFLTPEPNWRNIPKRCPECGQMLEKLTRKEAERVD